MQKPYYDLPEPAGEYIEFIENFVGVKIKWVGTGPDREAMIKHAPATPFWSGNFSQSCSQLQCQ
jgi:adenylosuccinate synthase